MSESKVTSARRQIKTFGVRTTYTKKDGRWVEDPGQTSLDQRINTWVDESGNVIVNLTATFQDYFVSEEQMYTDYLYVVTFETQEDYHKARAMVPAVMSEQVKQEPSPAPQSVVPRPQFPGPKANKSEPIFGGQAGQVTPMIGTVASPPPIQSPIPQPPAGEREPAYPNMDEEFVGLNANLHG